MAGWSAWTRDDWRALDAHAASLSARAADLALVLEIECAGNPAAVYYDGDYPVAVGLNQITSVNAGAMGISEATRRAIPSMSIQQQLPLVVRSFRAAVGARSFGDAGALYQANFAPGRLVKLGSADGVVLYREGVDGNAYKFNRWLDVDNDGAITMRDIRAVLRKRAGEPRFRAALAALNAAVPGAGEPRLSGGASSGWILPIAGLSLIGVGVMLVRTERLRLPVHRW